MRDRIMPGDEHISAIPHVIFEIPEDVCVSVKPTVRTEVGKGRLWLLDE